MSEWSLDINIMLCIITREREWMYKGLDNPTLKYLEDKNGSASTVSDDQRMINGLVFKDDQRMGVQRWSKDDQRMGVQRWSEDDQRMGVQR